MARSGPPDTLSPRHEYAALLVAAGYRNGDVCQIVGISYGRLSIIKTSPLFQALVEQRKIELASRQMDVIANRLHAQAGPTLDTLVELRNGSKPEVRLGAANSLADRIPALAKRTLHDETRAIHITFGARELAEMARAQAEYEGLGAPRLGPGTAAIETTAEVDADGE